ncbi:S-adenosyl-L-methionine-dependent methyltransferase [Staphylotrichum tortipilum]|uniref:Arsenite methyltransferase n=1 Tax=Staphylotrichum tortipilum TaxID=2831512 RepID=A0AAN6RRF7_9PEZI|nr:S-adenosyl-L-methionine-dependent methyltransferase [Staphylotrichum longicolle]
MDTSKIYAQVREHYSSASRSTSAKYGEAVAKSFGYTADELASIPQDANLGLSCGNPLALASLKEGETVLDLGCGAGFDIFLASPKVGPSGRAIGIDMNEDMLTRARHLLSTRPATPTTDNISFLNASITSIPLPPSSAHCIISNCVINLVPAADKPLVFREMHRLLKPGGRVAVSDILAKVPLPDWVRRDVALYVGCVAGAGEVGEYERWLAEAGFGEVLIMDTRADLNVYMETGEDGEKKSSCCAPSEEEEKAVCCVPAEKEAPPAEGCCAPARGGEKPATKLDLNEYVASYKIFAVKV